MISRIIGRIFHPHQHAHKAAPQRERLYETRKRQGDWTGLA